MYVEISQRQRASTLTVKLGVRFLLQLLFCTACKYLCFISVGDRMFLGMQGFDFAQI